MFTFGSRLLFRTRSVLKQIISKGDRHVTVGCGAGLSSHAMTQLAQWLFQLCLYNNEP